MSSLHGWTAGSSDSFTAFLVRGICTALLTPAMPGSPTEQNCNTLLADFSDQCTGMLQGPKYKRLPICSPTDTKLGNGANNMMFGNIRQH